MPIGTLTLHRFNGDEIYNVSEATIRYFVRGDCVHMDFRVNTEDKPVQTLPDTEELHVRPNGQWQTVVPIFGLKDWNGRTFSIPQGYDEESAEYLTNLYYVEHETIDENQISVLEHEGERLLVQITGMMPDVNYYDDSKPPTQVEIIANFSIAQSGEPIEPIE
jgi:hypothetical protein